MSCIWKSQDLLGPPVGPMGSDEHVSRASALESEAEHKRKESALLDSSYQVTLTSTSSSLSPMGRQSSSPFFGGLAGHPEDLLARLQDACLAGGAIPEFSFAPRQASTTAFASSRTLRSSLSSDDAPIFGLSDDLAKTIVSPPMPHSTGPLRFSTGTFLMPKATSHRRTRSHFYTTGEAPIFATGNELEDDDESSDEEDNSELPKQRDTFEDPSNAVFQLDTVPIIKATSEKGPLKAEPTLAGGQALEASSLAPRPSTFASSLTASSNTIASSHPQDTSQPQHKCNKSGDKAPKRPSAPKVETPVPEALFRFEDLINSPFAHGSQDSVEYTREKEWKALELQVQESYNKPNAHDEFDRLCACASHNLGKNRYPNVLALDSTRVHLTPTEPSNCNYINANFVRGASDSVYISAQAPLPDTFGDFWRMIWEQKVHIIVMLTRLIEDGRPKAHKYWPTTKTRVFGGKFKVTMVNWVDTEADFRIKEFELECDGERRRIFQFHYRGWPDHGVPTSPDSLLRMTRSVDAHLEELRAHPFAEGPSPRPPAAYPPRPLYDERSSLTSSCSGSVASNGERRSLEEPEPLSAVQQQQYGITRRSSSSQFTVSSSVLGGSSGTPTSPKWSSSPTVPPRRFEEATGKEIPAVRADSLFAATSSPSSRSASQLRSLRPSTPSMVTGSPSAATPPASVVSSRNHHNGDGPSTHGQDLSPPSRREFRSTSPVSSPSSDAWLETSSHSTHTTSSLSSTTSSLTSNPASVASSVAMSASSSSSSHLSVPAGHPFAAQHAFALVSPPAGSGSNIPSTASMTAPSNVGGTPIPAPDRSGEYKIGPMLVHCSAGIGRSGAFIIIHSVLERIAASGMPVTDITLFHLLQQMRESRAGLVPHQNQYDFCYTAIEHSLQVKRIAHELASGGGPSLREHISGKARQALQSSTLNRSSHRVPYISNDPPF